MTGIRKTIFLANPQLHQALKVRHTQVSPHSMQVKLLLGLITCFLFVFFTHVRKLFSMFQ